MPFGRKSKDANKGNSKVSQQSQRQPVLKVDLPETKTASNTDPVSNWETLDQDKKRRSSGDSVGDACFRPDYLCDGVTERKKPTWESLKHKVAKSVGLSKSKDASCFQEEPQSPLSPTTGSHVSEDASSVDVHSPERGAVGRGNGLQEAAEHPLAPNRVPTLDSYIELPEEKDGGTAPQSEKVNKYSQGHNNSLTLNICPHLVQCYDFCLQSICFPIEILQNGN